MHSKYLRVATLAALTLMTVTGIATSKAETDQTSWPSDPGVHGARKSGVESIPTGLVPIVANILASRAPHTWNARRDGTLLMDDHRQNFRASISPRSTQLRIDEGRRGQLTLALIGFRSGGSGFALHPDAVTVQGSRVTRHYGHGLVEWYLDTPLGLEQGFTITAPPAARTVDPIALTFALQGDLNPVADAKGIEFEDASGRDVLRYGDLAAFDARHRRLPARLQLHARQLRLTVDTAGAVYPVTVDPLFAATATILPPSEGAYQQFGVSVALSADGRTALIGSQGISAPNGAPAAGEAYIYTSGPDGWTMAASFDDPPQRLSDEFGTTVALSADGTVALIGTNPAQCACGGTSPRPGAVYLYSSTSGVWPSTPTAVFAGPGSVASEEIPYTIALSGNGQSVALGNVTTGVYLFQEANGSWPSTPVTINPATGSGGFGSSIAFNTEGNEVLIGAPSTEAGSILNLMAGSAYLYVESGGNWPATPNTTFSNPVPSAGNSFGTSVALTPDGTVAAMGSDAGCAGACGSFATGAAYVYSESGGTWPSTPTGTFIDPNPPSGQQQFTNDNYGLSLAVSADGSTVFVGAPDSAVLDESSGFLGTGIVYAFRKSGGSWPTTPTDAIENPDGPPSYGGRFGSSIAISGNGNFVLGGAPLDGISNAGEVIGISGPIADLALSGSAKPASVPQGGTVTYSFTVQNDDSQVTTTAIGLQISLVSGLVFKSANADGGSCTKQGSSGTVRCTFAGLAPRQRWAPSITVVDNAPGLSSVQAVVADAVSDTNTGNNSVQLKVTNTTASSGGGAFGLSTLLALAILGLLARRRRGLRRFSTSLAGL